MAEVTRTELNQQTASVLARGAAGERLTVTDRGRAVAEITPPHRSRLADLRAAGRTTPPTQRGALPFPPVERADSVAEILADTRGDR